MRPKLDGGGVAGRRSTPATRPPRVVTVQTCRDKDSVAARQGESPISLFPRGGRGQSGNVGLLQ